MADRELLEQAEDIEARGIVTGGLVPELIPYVEQLPFPVIVTDGIGHTSMAGPIFDLLRANEGEEASVSGHAQARWEAKRPEVIIPKLDKTPPGNETEHDEGLKVGTRVRIVRAPYAGRVGEVVSVPRHARRIETGARVPCAEIDIGQDDPVSVPFVNLDVLR
jgi:transcription antitermination factor NusG